ncbi:MAG: biopolymer transporter ExbD [Candidatus Sulfotelmatobacter sp.]
MNRLLSVSLIALTLTGGAAPKMVAQAPALQKGVRVELASTSSATPAPDADNANAWIVAVTENGTVYLGTDPITPAALAGEMKNPPRDRQQKLYIKADARTPYADVMRVLEAARAAGVAAPTLLTAQQESPAPGTIVSPKGLEVLLDAPSSSSSILVQVLSSEQARPTLKVNSQDVAPAKLQGTLAQLLQNRSEKMVLMNSSGAVSFADVAHVIDVCRSVGARVVLATPAL